MNGSCETKRNPLSKETRAAVGHFSNPYKHIKLLCKLDMYRSMVNFSLQRLKKQLPENKNAQRMRN